MSFREATPIPNRSAGAASREAGSRQGLRGTRSNSARGAGPATSDIVLPQWQPDVDVGNCPICRTQFSFFIRKHHCRKCGRVVCAACSPHRIIIPHQYIVRPPGSFVPTPPRSPTEGSGYFDVNGPSGGVRVRLCNPCVPDPNTAPPESPTPAARPDLPSTRRRSQSGLASSHGAARQSNRYGTVFTLGEIRDPLQSHSRGRSITVSPLPTRLASQNTPRQGGNSSLPSVQDMARLASRSSNLPPQVPTYRQLQAAAMAGEASASSSRQRALPPTPPPPPPPPPPQLLEEDECPVCHRELPARSLPDFESLRESHITTCIQVHSAYNSPRRSEGTMAGPQLPRRTGMYVYSATEKDCVDDAECTICLEEFTVGVPMARLECLCRFHKSCISAWFVNHPGRCPVHQHDGFGF